MLYIYIVERIVRRWYFTCKHVSLFKSHMLHAYFLLYLFTMNILDPSFYRTLLCDLQKPTFLTLLCDFAHGLDIIGGFNVHMSLSLSSTSTMPSKKTGYI